jgi:poly(glycerol-phosphate) alpha-glucosyltransferase
MTILHVTPYFAPAWAFGGVTRAVTDLGRAQVRAGHTVLTLTTDAESRRARIDARSEIIDGVHVTRVRNVSLAARARLNLSTPAGFRRAAERIAAEHRVDVVHCHELRTIETRQAARARLPGVPAVVLSPHGTVPYATGRAWAKRAWDAVSARAMLPRFDAVIALTSDESADVRALWRRFGVRLADDQVAVIPNGVDAAAFDHLPAREAARARFGLGDGPVVLFLGRLSGRKGPALLVSAFAGVAAAVPGARLLLVGPDEDAGRVVFDAIASHGLADRVVRPGFLTGDDRLAALAAADVFALPAVGEGLPVAALEAMAAGVPVVLAPECHVARAAEAGAGLVVPRDAAAWTTALAALLRDDDRRAEMSRRARALAADEFAWPAIVRAIDDVYAHARTRAVGHA